MMSDISNHASVTIDEKRIFDVSAQHASVTIAGRVKCCNTIRTACISSNWEFMRSEMIAKQCLEQASAARWRKLAFGLTSLAFFESKNAQSLQDTAARMYNRYKTQRQECTTVTRSKHNRFKTQLKGWTTVTRHSGTDVPSLQEASTINSRHSWNDEIPLRDTAERMKNLYNTQKHLFDKAIIARDGEVTNQGNDSRTNESLWHQRLF